MSDENLQALIAYRLEQAQEALKESGVLLKENAHRGAINRAYYAMFYALQALLVSRSLKTSKHSGAISLFDRDFVKQGQFRKGLSKSLHEVFDLRQDADYGEAVHPTGEQSRQALKDAQTFVAEVTEFLNSPGLASVGAE